MSGKETAVVALDCRLLVSSLTFSQSSNAPGSVAWLLLDDLDSSGGNFLSRKEEALLFLDGGTSNIGSGDRVCRGDEQDDGDSNSSVAQRLPDPDTDILLAQSIP